MDKCDLKPVRQQHILLAIRARVWSVLKPKSFFPRKLTKTETTMLNMCSQYFVPWTM